METANYWNFSKSKGHNSVKNGSIIPKREFELDIFYDKSVYQISFQYVKPVRRKNERKLGGPTDRPTDSSKAICPSFFEGTHKN
jgi:hypothetical protein